MKLIVALLVTLATVPAAAAADSFRCPQTGKLVTVGLRQGEVLAKCRAPDLMQEHVETKRTARSVTQVGRALTPFGLPPVIAQYLQSRGLIAAPLTPTSSPVVVTRAVPTAVTTTQEHEVQIVVSDWIYDFGASRFIRALRFENGVLVAIEEGSYGSDDSHQR